MVHAGHYLAILALPWILSFLAFFLLFAVYIRLRSTTTLFTHFFISDFLFFFAMAGAVDIYFCLLYIIIIQKIQ